MVNRTTGTRVYGNSELPDPGPVQLQCSVPVGAVQGHFVETCCRAGILVNYRPCLRLMAGTVPNNKHLAMVYSTDGLKSNASTTPRNQIPNDSTACGGSGHIVLLAKHVNDANKTTRGEHPKSCVLSLACMHASARTDENW